MGLKCGNYIDLLHAWVSNVQRWVKLNKNLQHDGLNPKGTEECRERKPSTATHIQYTHTIRNTHHPHVSALSSCIQACWGRPRACDCVRGEFWVANSIWTEDPILRCQYSPHYLCSLLIQGRGGGSTCWTKMSALIMLKTSAHQEVRKCGTNIHYGQMTLLKNNRGENMQPVFQDWTMSNN